MPDPERRPFFPPDSGSLVESERRSATFSSFGIRESTQSGAILAGRYQVRGFMTHGSMARVAQAASSGSGPCIAS